MGIERLLEKASAYIKEPDLLRIQEAYEFAEQAHHGQVRKSGEPYILHPLAVADIVVNMQMDTLSIIAALLHDVVEDTTVSLEQIRERFGDTCAMLVDGLTKLERIQFRSKEEQQNENYRKMFIAMARDIRVIVIKLADRLHNMRTLKYQSEESQRRISYETLEIFCPIAHRLGISAIKWEMEDIALRYLNPQQYYRIANLMHKKRAEREQYIDNVIVCIREKLDEMGIQADLSGRPKHIYSVFKKMTVKNKQFNEIYDLLAIRIIVDNIKDCYATLGIIHTLWKPMPGRFKDYIAMPKTNMYQSLHTTVVGPNGEPTEVQIRTWEMHRTAEFGIAAHWAYKEGSAGNGGSFDNKMTFFREILELQHETKDASEFVESLKMDFFSDLVFVFTPKGEVIELPSGSVPLDFAYRIHTEVGNRTIGAKVNGRIVPLDHQLKTGDIVEILTSKHSYGPSQDWLKIAQSSHARSKIKQWFKKEKREENVEKGREMLEREIKRLGLDVSEWTTDDKLMEAAKKFAFNDIEDMLSAVGFGGITAAQICTKVTEKLRKEQEEANQLELTSEMKEIKPAEKRSRPTNGVRVKGIDNLLVRFARCCNPVPGDDIVGYVTRGRGVSVHRSDCANLPTTDEGEDAARVIEVEWETAVEANYSVDIEVTGHDRNGLLNEVLQAVSESKTNISAVTGRSDKNKMAMIHMTILIRNTDHLQSVVERIKRVKDVYTVHRIMQ
ncbi:bifunctional (p)ppGpp synthetase/guanosine-3',5'-bis(diphosphate) 3'-pyrophosphohydrolase [Paenibacillus lautus]|jgi:GTP pyrophosphokinase|uniref:GTP pyrophosphokinase n=1 Tax=Paenibacillus lautus TaxID=1401 RepID=A0A2A5LPE5_PAELA|nr:MULTISPECIES: bifunctional (p)ppGpp synthetase/guanosine-3',5'-bis(diphosphate) 3'-pyrophosphohydrolase [Paenibacillus]MBY0158488.1 bifunctional (p)ppGpp synthetase/guanosine-3',5'-bis(diphosphate) 3'-pyrophosphohydrolase [Cytobacillus firmus]ACX63856.1 (p)ppGpp synthetase I, SpoT/RelA [Paenibacillus sp. Y412MC10]AYB45765.1 bifunctional (p)ppGpp synthetase/guanosine-3',5'-bis(diphosphate) 3'-pyrophosphohydrolase [Paenibacillus lautus]EGG35309.1 GTP diphosphokinase [Paenibacillus sp. HGF5]ET